MWRKATFSHFRGRTFYLHLIPFNSFVSSLQQMGVFKDINLFQLKIPNPSNVHLYNKFHDSWIKRLISLFQGSLRNSGLPTDSQKDLSLVHIQKKVGYLFQAWSGIKSS
mgnify:CR=1 FL=1